MFRDLSSLHTPEWFKAFRPSALVDKLLFIFRVLLSKLARISNKFIPYKDRLIVRDYVIISFNKKSIEMVNVDGYTYTVAGIKDTFEILGYNIGAPAIRGIDYKIVDDIYYFKSNPSRYCMVFEKDGEVWYKTIGVASSLTQTPQVLQQLISSDLICSTNYDTMMRGFTGGISNMDVLARQGICCIGGFTGNPVEIWEEGGRVFSITDTGSFIHAPSNAKLVLDYGTPVRLLNDLPSIFFVKLNNIAYPVLAGVNAVDNYPGIREHFNNLTIYNDKFIGLELLKILKNQGCNFTELGYIKYNDMGGNICQYGRYITRLDDIIINDKPAVISYGTVNTVARDVSETINLDIEITVRYL
jgi:hypothetical protein